MKQGASIDMDELSQPWCILYMNFFMENMDKAESNCSFKPLNVEIGWNINASDQDEAGEEEKDNCTSCKE